MAAGNWTRRWAMAAACTVAFAAQAAYPDKPIKIIVPGVAGGSPDVLTRLIGNELEMLFGFGCQLHELTPVFVMDHIDSAPACFALLVGALDRKA